MNHSSDSALHALFAGVQATCDERHRSEWHTYVSRECELPPEKILLIPQWDMTRGQADMLARVAKSVLRDSTIVLLPSRKKAMQRGATPTFWSHEEFSHYAQQLKERMSIDKKALPSASLIGSDVIRGIIRNPEEDRFIEQLLLVNNRVLPREGHLLTLVNTPLKARNSVTRYLENQRRMRGIRDNFLSALGIGRS